MNTFPKFKQKRIPVTVIVGIICDRWIVLACDSQTTDQSGNKRTDTNKLSMVKFKNGEALVAQSGSTILGNHALQILHARAGGIEISNYDTTAETLRDSIYVVETVIKHN